MSSLTPSLMTMERAKFDESGNVKINLAGVGVSVNSILSNATVTTSGSSSVVSKGISKHIELSVKLGTVSGTTPTFKFDVQCLDENGNVIITYAGNTLSTTNATDYIVIDGVFTGSKVKVVWTVTGTTPQATGVYVYLYIF